MNIYFLFLSFFILFNPIAIMRIYRSENFFIFSEGGFGHQVWQLDYARYLKKEKTFFILLYDPSRHNKYLSSCYGFLYLNIQTCTNIKYKFGEFEGGNTFLIKKFIIFFLKNILKKKNILVDKEIYFKLQSEHLKSGLNAKISEDLRNKKYLGHVFWQNHYYHCIVNKLLPKPNLPDKILSILNKKIKKKLFNDKTCVLYLRRKEDKTITSTIRNGGLANDYYKTIFYLNSINYNIFLVGEANKILGQYINKFNNVFDHNFFRVDKKLFEIYCAFNHDFMIAECGGYHNLGFYSEHSLGINFFPYGYMPPGFKNVLYKKIYKNGIETKKEENHLDYHDLIKKYSIEELFKYYVNNSEFVVKNNDEIEIYLTCKKIIENYDKKNI